MRLAGLTTPANCSGVIAGRLRHVAPKSVFRFGLDVAVARRRQLCQPTEAPLLYPILTRPRRYNTPSSDLHRKFKRSIGTSFAARGAGTAA